MIGGYDRRMQIFDTEATRSALPFGALIEALRQGTIAGAGVRSTTPVDAGWAARSMPTTITGRR